MEISHHAPETQAMSALTLLDQMLAVINHVEAHARLVPVARYLRDHRYSGFSIEYTLRRLAEGMPLDEMHWVLDEDREAVAALLAGPEDCIPGCADCQDCADFRRGLLGEGS